MPRPDRSKALLVFPRFAGTSFWNYRATCDLNGSKFADGGLTGEAVPVEALRWAGAPLRSAPAMSCEHSAGWTPAAETGGASPAHAGDGDACASPTDQLDGSSAVTAAQRAIEERRDNHDAEVPGDVVDPGTGHRFVQRLGGELRPQPPRRAGVHELLSD